MQQMSSVKVKIVIIKYLFICRIKKEIKFIFKINTYLIEHEYIDRISCSIKRISC